MPNQKKPHTKTFYNFKRDRKTPMKIMILVKMNQADLRILLYGSDKNIFFKI